MTIPDLFQKVALFSGIPAEDRLALARAATVRTYRRGDVIVRQGQPGESFFVIVKGRVAVTILSPDGREVVLNTLGEGDHFGEMALVDDAPRSASVVAQERSELALLSREVFVDLLRSNFVLTRALLATLSRRLRRANATIEGLAALDVKSRLARYFRELAATRGKKAGGGWAVVVRPSQREIADTIGSSRETVSRTMSQMAEQQLIVPKGASSTCGWTRGRALRRRCAGSRRRLRRGDGAQTLHPAESPDVSSPRRAAVSRRRDSGRSAPRGPRDLPRRSHHRHRGRLPGAPLRHGVASRGVPRPDRRQAFPRFLVRRLRPQIDAFADPRPDLASRHDDLPGRPHPGCLPRHVSRPGHPGLPPSILGKLTTFSEISAIVAILLTNVGALPGSVARTCFGVVAVLAVASGLHYVFRASHGLAGHRKPTRIPRSPDADRATGSGTRGRQP